MSIPARNVFFLRMSEAILVSMYKKKFLSTGLIALYPSLYKYFDCVHASAPAFCISLTSFSNNCTCACMFVHTYAYSTYIKRQLFQQMSNLLKSARAFTGTFHKIIKKHLHVECCSPAVEQQTLTRGSSGLNAFCCHFVLHDSPVQSVVYENMPINAATGHVFVRRP